jgi:CPA2 family monovalent cation:H+ antiporter-2
MSKAALWMTSLASPMNSRKASAIAVTLVAVYLVNHVLNMVVLRLFNESWHDAFVGGALLAQIGELSFLLASAGQSLGIINEFSYQFTISLISLTLIASPFWIAISCQIAKRWQPVSNEVGETAVGHRPNDAVGGNHQI